MKANWAWMPAIIMGLGGLFTVGIDTQRSMALRAPLDHAIPRHLSGHVGRDLTIPDDELAVAGATDYLMRVYALPSDSGQALLPFTVYVGYYDRQLRGKTIHSPKNCLPGAGWKVLQSATVPIATSLGGITVNRYLLENDGRRVLVLYWYQGRGRVQANEYLVKWDLLRDAALMQRSDESLVRVIVPIQQSEESAFELASDVAEAIVPRLSLALPE